MSTSLLSGQIVALSPIHDSPSETEILLAKLQVRDSLSEAGGNSFILLHITGPRLVLEIGDFVLLVECDPKSTSNFLYINGDAVRIVSQETSIELPRVDLALLKSSHDARPAINYRGTITKKLAHAMFELDDSHRLLCLSNLNVGTEYTFFNLGIFEDGSSSGTGIFIYCPVFSSGAPLTDQSCSPLDYLYLHGKQKAISKLVSLAKCGNDSDPLEMTRRIITAAREGCRRATGDLESSLMDLFFNHSVRGSCSGCECVFFNTPLLTVSDLLQETGDMRGIMLGQVSICLMTGRAKLADASGSVYIANSFETVASNIDGMVLVGGMRVIKDDLIPGATVKYIYFSSISELCRPLGSHVVPNELILTMPSLFIIKSITNAQLLTKAGPMTVILQVYKFGSLSFQRPTGRSDHFSGIIEMVQQTSLELSLPAVDAVKKRLGPGTILCSSQSDLGDSRRLSFEPAAHISSAKQILLGHVDQVEIVIRCSVEAAKYLTESMNLLHPTITPAVETSEIFSKQRKFVDSMQARIVSREFLDGSKVGLPSLPVYRERLDSFQDYLIGLPTNKYLVVSLQTGTEEIRVIFAPNHHLLYPVGMVPRATVSMTHIKVISTDQGPYLLATSQTKVELLRFDDAQNVTSVYRQCFLHELPSLAGPRERLLCINGQFLSIEDPSPNDHAGPALLKHLEEFVSIGLFTDGTGLCELVGPRNDNVLADKIHVLDVTRDYIVNGCCAIAKAQTKTATRTTVRGRWPRLIVHDIQPVKYQEATLSLLCAFENK